MHDNAQNSIFAVDETSDLPIWVQLRNRMAFLIRTGVMQAGEQLPSVRSLAAEAKINYNTVTKAYRDLELGGLIVSVRGRGMYVQKNAARDSEPEEAATDAIVEDCIQQYRSLGMTFEEIDAHMQGITHAMKTKAASAAEEKMEYYYDAH